MRDIYRSFRNFWIGWNVPVKDWPYYMRAYKEADRQGRMERNQLDILKLLKEIAKKR